MRETKTKTNDVACPSRVTLKSRSPEEWRVPGWNDAFNDFGRHVFIIEETDRGPSEIRYRIYDSADPAREIEGYVSGATQDGRQLWRPYIRSATRAGFWNAGDTADFMKGYPDPYTAFDALFKEAEAVLGDDSNV